MKQPSYGGYFSDFLRVVADNGWLGHLRPIHEGIAREAGIPGIGLLNLRNAPAFAFGSPTTAAPYSQGLTELQMAALDYADHVTRNIRVPQSVFDRIRGMLKSDREIVEVTATIAGYNFTTRILRPLDAAGLMDTPVPVPQV